MKYSAGIISVPYLFIESFKTAQLFVEGLSSTEVKRTVFHENLYQLQSDYLVERYFNAINRRLNGLPESLIQDIAQGGVAQAKLLLVIAIMRTDLLFFEFMHEMFRIALNMSSSALETKDINQFFNQKASQSEIVAGWNDTTTQKIKQSFIRVLFEAGLISSVKEPRTIIRGYLSETVVGKLRKADFSTYMACVLGDAYV